MHLTQRITSRPSDYSSWEQVIIGIDPSSLKYAAVITGPDDVPTTVVCIFPKTSEMSERCAYAYKQARALAKQIQAAHPLADVHAFIEEPVVGRGGAYATIAQAKVHGAIVAGLRNGGASVKGVNNSHAKKAVVGKGNAGKPEIRRWCQVYWRQCFDKILGFKKGDQQDLCDAAMINRQGAIILETMNRLRKYRQNEHGIARKQRSRPPLKRKRVLP